MLLEEFNHMVHWSLSMVYLFMPFVKMFALPMVVGCCWSWWGRSELKQQKYPILGTEYWSTRIVDPKDIRLLWTVPKHTLLQMILLLGVYLSIQDSGYACSFRLKPHSESEYEETSLKTFPLRGPKTALFRKTFSAIPWTFPLAELITRLITGYECS